MFIPIYIHVCIICNSSHILFAASPRWSSTHLRANTFSNRSRAVMRMSAQNVVRNQKRLPCRCVRLMIQDSLERTLHRPTVVSPDETGWTSKVPDMDRRDRCSTRSSRGTSKWPEQLGAGSAGHDLEDHPISPKTLGQLPTVLI